MVSFVCRNHENWLCGSYSGGRTFASGRVWQPGYPGREFSERSADTERADRESLDDIALAMPDGGRITVSWILLNPPEHEPEIGLL